MKFRLNIKLGSIIIFVTFLLFLFGVLYFGYTYYIDRYYIKLYDEDIIKYLEVPPYSKKITPAYFELVGECRIKTLLTLDEIILFYSTTLIKRGYLISYKEQGAKFEITIGRDYTVKCHQENKDEIVYRWQPRLNSKLSMQLKKYFPDKELNR